MECRAASYLNILIGENNKKIQSRLVGNVNLIILMIIMMIFGFIFMKPLLTIMGATGEVYEFAKDYFLITLFGSIFWIAGIAYNMIVRNILFEGKVAKLIIYAAIFIPQPNLDL